MTAKTFTVKDRSSAFLALSAIIEADGMWGKRSTGHADGVLLQVAEVTGHKNWTLEELRPFLALELSGNAVSVERAYPLPKLPEGVLPFANQRGYSDWGAYEVLAAPKPGVLVIRGMDAKLDPTWKPNMIPGGFCAHTTNNGEQRYLYKSNPDRPAVTIRQSKAKSPRKNGKWFDKGGNEYKPDAQPFTFHDYNF